MAFNVGAALESFGQIAPATQEARQRILQEKRDQIEFDTRQREAALSERSRQQEIESKDRQSKTWIPVRSYKDQNGATKTVYLTPEGYKEETDDPGPKTYQQYMSEAAAVFGSADKVPQWYQDQALAKSAGLNYRQPTQRIGTTLIPDPQHPGQFLKQSYDPFTGDPYSEVASLPPRGLMGSETDTARTDPATGLTTNSTSVRKPIIPGVGGSPSSAGPRGGSTIPPHVAAGLSAPVVPPATPSGKTPAGLAPLDQDGHIPQQRGLTETVRSVANAMIDGQDDKDIQAPSAVKAVAKGWAQKYGVGRGLYSPREIQQITVAKGFLDKLQNDPSLSVLDNTASRLKVSQIINAKEHGVIGNAASTALAATLTPAEQQFITNYNYAASTITGLSQTLRSGRATEAMVGRLQKDLPNPLTTSSSSAAKDRLENMQQEIRLALGSGGQAKVAAKTADANKSEPQVLKFNEKTGRLE